MNTLVQMEQLIQEMKPDASKLYQQNIKAYAVQLRTKAQAMKVLAQQMREEALAHHHSIVGRGANKTVGGVRPALAPEPEQEPELGSELGSELAPEPAPVPASAVPVVPSVPVVRRTRQTKAKPAVQH